MWAKEGIKCIHLTEQKMNLVAYYEGGMIMKYRKKPLIIEAIELRDNNILQVEEFIEQKEIKLDNRTASDKFDDFKDIVRSKGRPIETLEGTMNASIGDFIIRGINGEVYPCKKDIFHKTYEPV